MLLQPADLAVQVLHRPAGGPVFAKEIGALSHSAENNAATAQEVSAVVQEQNAAMSNVSTSSQQLARVAERLKNSLRTFET